MPVIMRCSCLSLAVPPFMLLCSSVVLCHESRYTDLGVMVWGAKHIDSEYSCSELYYCFCSQTVLHALASMCDCCDFEFKTCMFKAVFGCTTSCKAHSACSTVVIFVITCCKQKS